MRAAVPSRGRAYSGGAVTLAPGCACTVRRWRACRVVCAGWRMRTATRARAREFRHGYKSATRWRANTPPLSSAPVHTQIQPYSTTAHTHPITYAPNHYATRTPTNTHAHMSTRTHVHMNT